MENDSDEEEDESDDDDEEDDVPPHDIRSEGVPRLPIYDPSFKKAEQLSIEINRTFQTFLESSPYEDKEKDWMLKELKDIEYPPFKDARVRIGFIGDSGVGKSSLLNSLLGTTNIAREVWCHSSLLKLTLLTILG